MGQGHLRWDSGRPSLGAAPRPTAPLSSCCGEGPSRSQRARAPSPRLSEGRHCSIHLHNSRAWPVPPLGPRPILLLCPGLGLGRPAGDCREITDLRPWLRWHRPAQLTRMVATVLKAPAPSSTPACPPALVNGHFSRSSRSTARRCPPFTDGAPAWTFLSGTSGSCVGLPPSPAPSRIPGYPGVDDRLSSPLLSCLQRSFSPSAEWNLPECGDLRMWVPPLWGEKLPETPLPIERSAEFGIDLGRNPSMCFSHCPAFKNKKAKALILEVNGVL